MGTGYLDLPLREAWKFHYKEYRECIERIKSLKQLQGWQEHKFRDVKRWELKELFERKGTWGEFKEKHWPNGNEKDGQRRLDNYKKAADAYQSRVPPREPVILQVRLSEDELEKLEEKAEKFGVDSTTLARIWILERLS